MLQSAIKQADGGLCQLTAVAAREKAGFVAWRSWTEGGGAREHALSPESVANEG